MCLHLFPVPLSASWVQPIFPQSQAVIILSLAPSSLHCGLNTKLLSRQRGGGAEGELLMESGSRGQGWGSTLCQPLPSPTLTSQISCPPTHASSVSPSHHFPTGDGRRALSLFHQKGLQDFDTLLLSGDGGTLYVGAREAILALDIQDPGMPKLRNMVRRWGRRVCTGGGCCRCSELPALA